VIASRTIRTLLVGQRLPSVLQQLQANGRPYE
jgi:hypothetical protein